MKRSTKRLVFTLLGLFFAFVVLGIVSYYSAPKKDPLAIEMVAFSSLNDDEQALIPASPKDSTVKKIPVNDEIKTTIAKNYREDQVYAVTFHHTETDFSGNLVVFVGLDKNTVVGKGFTAK